MQQRAPLARLVSCVKPGAGAAWLAPGPMGCVANDPWDGDSRGDGKLVSLESGMKLSA